jgi:hypothetical protein
MNNRVLQQSYCACLLFSFWFGATSSNVFAEDRAKGITPLEVSEKGEKLIKALATTCKSPHFTQSSEYHSIFPKDFDWKEYRRVITAIKELEANAAEVFPSIIEHMTDKEYCVIVEADGSSKNYSRGDVCFQIARSWVNRGYIGTMPETSPPHCQYQAPNDMKNNELKDWFRERYNKKLLYEIQIEAAEWAITFVPKSPSLKEPQEILDFSKSAIQKRITELRESRKPFPAKFFVTDFYCPYSEERHAAGVKIAK